MEKGPRPEGADIGEFFRLEESEPGVEGEESAEKGDSGSAKEKLSEFFRLEEDSAAGKLEQAKSQDLKESQEKIEAVMAELQSDGADSEADPTGMTEEEAFTEQEREWFKEGDKGKE